MQTVTRSSYNTLLKVIIVGGVMFCFVLAVGCLWPVFADSSDGATVAIFLTMAAGFGGMGWFGLRLLPFVHSSCAATPDGLYVFDRHRQETFLPWSSISRVKDWPALQVVDVYDQHGKRVLSVDYYISNFEPFYAQLLESARAGAR